MRSTICKGLGSPARLLLTPHQLTLQTASTAPSCVCSPQALVCWLHSPPFPRWLLPFTFLSWAFPDLAKQTNALSGCSWQSCRNPSF